MTRDKTILIFTVVIILANIIVYSKTAGYDFVNYDDSARITKNPTVQELSPENIKTIFTEFQLGNYQPLVFLTHAIQYKLFKLDPRPYHITNIIFHVINSLLVFLLIYYILKNENIAFIVALFFSLHPMQVESVAWATELKGLMCAFFYLLSFITYVRYRANNKRGHYYLCIFLFVLAFLSKPVAITLPVIFVIYDYLFNKLDSSKLKEMIPFVPLMILFAVITVLSQKSKGAIDMVIMNSVVTNILFGFYNIGFYVIKLIFPKDLSVHYGYLGNIHIGSARFFIALFVIAASVLYVKYFKRIRREVNFGILFFIVGLLPVLKIIPLGDVHAANRYLYLPMIGFFFSVTTAIYPYAVSRKNIKSAVSVVAALYLGYLTLFTSNHLNTWRNSYTLWTNALEVSKEHYNPYVGLGYFYLDKEDYNNARKYFLIALEHKNPLSREVALHGLGLTSIQGFGGFSQAKEYFSKLVERFPDNNMGNNAEAYLYLCLISAESEQFVDAEKYFRHAYSLNAEFITKTHLGYAEQLEAAGQIKKAIFHYKLSLKYNKGWTVPENALKRLGTAK